MSLLNKFKDESLKKDLENDLKIHIKQDKPSENTVYKEVNVVKKKKASELRKKDDTFANSKKTELKLEEEDLLLEAFNLSYKGGKENKDRMIRLQKKQYTQLSNDKASTLSMSKIVNFALFFFYNSKEYKKYLNNLKE